MIDEVADALMIVDVSDALKTATYRSVIPGRVDPIVLSCIGPMVRPDRAAYRRPPAQNGRQFAPNFPTGVFRGS
jgi:hypothetical protein